MDRGLPVAEEENKDREAFRKPLLGVTNRDVISYDSLRFLLTHT